MKKELRGIALILFGILLSVSGDSINRTILSITNDWPFGFFGVISGAMGL